MHFFVFCIDHVDQNQRKYARETECYYIKGAILDAEEFPVSSEVLPYKCAAFTTIQKLQKDFKSLFGQMNSFNCKVLMLLYGHHGDLGKHKLLKRALCSQPMPIPEV